MSSFPKAKNFRMGSRIMIGFTAVAEGAQLFPLMHQHSTHRNFSLGKGFLGLHQGFLHPYIGFLHDHHLGIIVA